MPKTKPTNQNYLDYINPLFAPEDDTLSQIRAEMEQANIPAIQVSPSGGKTLHALALMMGAKRILEIGTLGGYSGTWLARALPADGQLISLELDPHHAEVSRRNLAQAGLTGKVEIRIGPAAESLQAMHEVDEALFDIAFIDANKDGYPQYLDLVLPLVRKGGLILGDNALLMDVNNPDTSTPGIAQYNAKVSQHPDLVSTMIPVFHSDRMDGLLVSVKRSNSNSNE